MSYRNAAPQRPKPASARSEPLQKKAPLIIGLALVAVVVLALVVWRTMFAGGYKPTEDDAIIKQAVSDPARQNVEPGSGALVNPEGPRSGLPMPGNKGRR